MNEVNGCSFTERINVIDISDSRRLATLALLRHVLYVTKLRRHVRINLTRDRNRPSATRAGSSGGGHTRILPGVPSWTSRRGGGEALV